VVSRFEEASPRGVLSEEKKKGRGKGVVSAGGQLKIGELLYGLWYLKGGVVWRGEMQTVVVRGRQ